MAQYREGGGDGPRYGQVRICWAEDEDAAKQTVFELWRHSGLGGTINQELPRPSDFGAVAESVTIEMATEGVPCGPDPAPVLEQIRTWEQAGFDRVALHQVGPDQDGFFRFWEQELQPTARLTATSARRRGQSLGHVRNGLGRAASIDSSYGRELAARSTSPSATAASRSSGSTRSSRARTWRGSPTRCGSCSRTCSGTATPTTSKRSPGWVAKDEPSSEISVTPARVLLQDFTGVPAIVDLAAMRDAMADLGGDPERINPLLPVELVIDHSVQVDEYGTRTAVRRNAELEFERNRERYAFLRWGQVGIPRT